MKMRFRLHCASLCVPGGRRALLRVLKYGGQVSLLFYKLFHHHSFSLP